MHIREFNHFLEPESKCDKLRGARALAAAKISTSAGRRVHAAPRIGRMRRMLLKLEELPGALAPGERLLGLDVGEKTVGMAVSDPGLSVASPVGVIRRGKIDADVAALAKVFKEYAVGALVVGLPLNLDGDEGPRAQSVRAFVRNLIYRKDALGGVVRATFWDERMSTSAVQRFMIAEADMTRKRRAQVVDKMAAAFILQGALDALHYLAATAADDDATSDED